MEGSHGTAVHRTFISVTETVFPASVNTGIATCNFDKLTIDYMYTEVNTIQYGICINKMSTQNQLLLGEVEQGKTSPEQYTCTVL